MTWQDTAKRLVEQDWWEWGDPKLSGLLLAHERAGGVWVDTQRWPWRPEWWPHVVKGGYFPDLTDWATVGILMGMVAEIAATEEESMIISFAPYESDLWLAQLFRSGINKEQGAAIAGEAVALLLLELKGEWK
jgi:hypothetical protein